MRLARSLPHAFFGRVTLLWPAPCEIGFSAHVAGRMRRPAVPARPTGQSHARHHCLVSGATVSESPSLVAGGHVIGCKPPICHHRHGFVRTPDSMAEQGGARSVLLHPADGPGRPLGSLGRALAGLPRQAGSVLRRAAGRRTSAVKAIRDVDGSSARR
jgi:hypothetical protein